MLRAALMDLRGEKNVKACEEMQKIIEMPQEALPIIVEMPKKPIEIYKASSPKIMSIVE